MSFRFNPPSAPTPLIRANSLTVQTNLPPIDMTTVGSLSDLNYNFDAYSTYQSGFTPNSAISLMTPNQFTLIDNALRFLPTLTPETNITQSYREYAQVLDVQTPSPDLTSVATTDEHSFDKENSPSSQVSSNINSNSTGRASVSGKTPRLCPKSIHSISDAEEKQQTQSTQKATEKPRKRVRQSTTGVLKELNSDILALQKQQAIISKKMHEQVAELQLHLPELFHKKRSNMSQQVSHETESASIVNRTPTV